MITAAMGSSPIASQTREKNFPNAREIKVRRCGGVSEAAAAGRSAKSIKLMPPSHTMAAAMCRNFIRAGMGSFKKGGAARRRILRLLQNSQEANVLIVACKA